MSKEEIIHKLNEIIPAIENIKNICLITKKYFPEDLKSIYEFNKIRENLIYIREFLISILQDENEKNQNSSNINN